ncbi:MAG: type II toxin-antitoxin system VapB family antitoxin [Thermoanaerobaculales bacterium]|nr:type II toxin-antitoxin system VapB family antitoxin [Thermoanaerobaculales bacterium]
MRTTIQLPDELLDQARRLALDSGDTLTGVIEGALRERLARRSSPPAQPVRLTTFGAKGLQPGVDLDDGAGLLDLMEER